MRRPTFRFQWLFRSLHSKCSHLSGRMKSYYKENQKYTWQSISFLGLTGFKDFVLHRDKKGFSRQSVMEPIAKTRSRTWNIQKHFHKWNDTWKPISLFVICARIIANCRKIGIYNVPTLQTFFVINNFQSLIYWASLSTCCTGSIFSNLSFLV